jgi:glycosyltransferase involved in cell wall biosynthesis
MARKGVDVLLAAYVRAFRVHDPVRLVIKGFPNPHNDVGARVARIRAGDPEAPEIVVINQDLSQTDLLALYRDADVMVLPTRGEGFNLPAAEAMAAGLGLIVTGHGGHMDFCSHTTARLLNFRLAPSQSHVAAEGSLWAEPDIADLVAALREATALDAPLWQARRAAARRRIDATMGEAECVRRIVAAAEACV